MIVVLAYARAQVRTVVIEAEHAVATVRAVLGALRPENKASLTKLQPVDAGVGGVGALIAFALEDEVLDPVLEVDNLRVAPGDVRPGAFRHEGRWDYSWIRAADFEKEEVREELQQNSDAEDDVPSSLGPDRRRCHSDVECARGDVYQAERSDQRCVRFEALKAPSSPPAEINPIFASEPLDWPLSAVLLKYLHLGALKRVVCQLNQVFALKL